MSDRTIKLCSIDGCSNKHASRGYCSKHLYRWRKYGNPLTLTQFSNPEEAFKARTEWHGDCLIWTGSKNRGYGRMSVNGKLMLSHRYAWEREYGSIPEGDTLDHICHNPSCVNVAHLRVASFAENGSYLSGPRVDNKSSGVRNVYPHKDKWIVKVTKSGVEHYYGIHDTLDAAATVAKQARRDLFGDFAGLG